MEHKQDYKESYKKRIQNNKQYKAFVNKDLAKLFDDKLKENNLKYSEWLRQEITKFIQKAKDKNNNKNI